LLRFDENDSSNNKTANAHYSLHTYDRLLRILNFQNFVQNLHTSSRNISRECISIHYPICCILRVIGFCECTIFIVAFCAGETFWGLMMVCKVVSLEAIHDTNELTFHGNTKVGLIAANLLMKRLDTENKNDYQRLRLVTLNLHC